MQVKNIYNFNIKNEAYLLFGLTMLVNQYSENKTES